MKRSQPFSLFLALIVYSVSASCAQSQQQVADTLYTNGKIYTVSEDLPWVEAVAIKDGKFIAIGKTDRVKVMAGDATEVIDLGGKFAMPGLNDAHVHMQNAYKPELLEDEILFLPSDEDSIEELQKIIKKFAENNPDSEHLFIQNLRYSLFPNNSPTKVFIDSVVSDRPVYIISEPMHEALFNTKALEAEGITKDTPDPPKGMITRDPETGEPTGWMKESACRPAWAREPKLSEEDEMLGLKGIAAYLNSVGITSVIQTHATEPIVAAAKKLDEQGDLTIRMGISWTWNDPQEPRSLEEQLKVIEERGKYASDMIYVDFVKISVDGNPGSTAFMLEPYVISKHRGDPTYTDDELFETIEKADRMGLGVTAHSIGDAGTRQFVNAIKKVKTKHGELNGRHVVSHGITIDPVEISQLKDLDISVEFSPVVWYPNSLTEANRPELGDERVNRICPMASVVKSGGRIAIASDGPIAWHEPLVTLETAVTRKAPGGTSEALNAAEAIDVKTAIKAMTLDSAYLIKQEDKVGSIEVGKRADMIILDKNILEIPATEIGTTKVLTTLLDGKVVFDRNKDPKGEEAIEASTGVNFDLTGSHDHRGCHL